MSKPYQVYEVEVSRCCCWEETFWAVEQDPDEKAAQRKSGEDAPILVREQTLAHRIALLLNGGK